MARPRTASPPRPTSRRSSKPNRRRELSDLRDADIPSVALQLSQAQLDQQAALSAEANIEQSKNLFSYLG